MNFKQLEVRKRKNDFITPALDNGRCHKCVFVKHQSTSVFSLTHKGCFIQTQINGSKLFRVCIVFLKIDLCCGLGPNTMKFPYSHHSVLPSGIRATRCTEECRYLFILIKKNIYELFFFGAES